MKIFLNKLYFIISVLYLCFLLSLSGCGRDGNDSGSKAGFDKPQERASALKKKPIASFAGYVDAKKESINFESLESSGKRHKGSAKKHYVSVTLSGIPIWDSVNKILSIEVTITNNTSDTLYGTYVTLEGFSPAGVAGVVNEYGYDPDGKLYFNHSPNGEKIPPSATGSSVTWKFNDPTASSFTFYGDVYADNWHQIAGNGISGTAWEDGSAEVKDRQFIAAMKNFNEKLYVLLGKQPHPPRNTGSNNDFKTQTGGAAASTYISGVEVWEYNPTAETWAQVNADGFGGSEDYLNFCYNNWAGCLGEFNGSLYAGTSKAIFNGGPSEPDNKSGGEIWKWAGSGTTWTKVHSMSDCKGIKDLLEFDGNFFATGFFRGHNKIGQAYTSRLDYSSTGTSGWTIVVSDAFGESIGTSIASAVSNVQFGASDKYFFISKGSNLLKPGVTLYRAGPANGTGKGTNYTNGFINWTSNGDWKRITDLPDDDIYATITSVPVKDNSPGNGPCSAWRLNVSYNTTPVDHALAHHWANNETQARPTVTIVDNIGNQIIYAVHGDGHTPQINDKLRLTLGANERGYSDTGNGTHVQLFTFAASSENTTSPPIDNSLWFFSNNLSQGVSEYYQSGAEMYSSSTGGSADSDFTRRLDFFTDVDYPVPGSSGGANLDGTSAIAGFGKKHDFTFAPGSHEGWLYVSAYPFQNENTGFRLFKTADGINWIKVTDDGFGSAWGAPKTFVSMNGKFYAGKSRLNFGIGVSGSINGLSGINATTTQFYTVDGIYSVPSIAFPTSGTIILDRDFNSDPYNYVPESTIVIEKVVYTDNKINIGKTLAVALPLNDGALAKRLWALDTQVVLESTAALPGQGAIQVDSELISYEAISGSTLMSLSRGTFGPSEQGTANHAKGTPVYRTSKRNGSDFGVVLSETSGLPSTGPSRYILIDNEVIKYATISGSTLMTPLRGNSVTDISAHSVGAAIFKPGFAGITRGQYGTTATNWGAGEFMNSGVSLGSAEIWVTD